ncbi:uncharacterized protein LOC108624701 [Ceratina calcarata]|uniref:Uncharacterized protein LOC108624701 n=1 Tax=Ceratina calcarata TaxID=156304 RepID=A0AAJ7IYD9_9HYME|nr:uncharacterized protein LOC108624701 [Ceratina calcarata]
MRNRGVEICIPTPQSTLPSNPLDVASLLNICGIRDIKQQKLLVRIHETLHGTQYKLNEMLQVATFISQQMSKGFGFLKSLRNAFHELCGSLDDRSKKEALRKMEEILLDNFQEELQMESSYDLDSITLRMSDLRCNSRLALIRQQGFLLQSTVQKLT